MPRINRLVREKLLKRNNLLPPPGTAEGCVDAVHHATLQELVDGRDQLRVAQDRDNHIANAGLAFAISAELQRRFRERLEAGLSKLELAEWAEVLEDPEFVRWSAERNATN